MKAKTAKRSPHRGNAVDEVYAVLYERIVQGTYPPGLRLSQLDLSNEFLTSRTPLREAMNRLQAGGLVVANKNRGMVVAPIRDDKTEDWYALRLMVEPVIVESVALQLTDGDLQAMGEALAKMRDNLERTRLYQEAHFAFHNVALMRYPEGIREIVESIYVHIERHQSRYFTRPHIAEDFADVDALLLQAFRDRDPAMARQMLEFHLIDAGLGMIRDVDSDKIPTTLRIAARGIGIEIDCPEQGPLARPTQMRWTRPSVTLPALTTANLKYTPPQ